MMGKDQENQVKLKGSREIDLKEIFNIIKRQLWVVIILTLAMAGLGFWYSSNHRPLPLYQSSTRVLINGTSTDMSTLMVMFTDPAVLSKLSKEIGISRSPSVLSNEISVSNINNSQIINLQVTDPNAYLAAEIANKDVSIFEEEVANVLDFNKINQLSSANVDPIPINQGTSHKLEIYATIAGVALGIFWCFFKNSLDETIRNEKDLEQLLSIPVVGTIPVMTKKNSRKYKSKHLRFIEFFKVRKYRIDQIQSNIANHEGVTHDDNLTEDQLQTRQLFPKVHNDN